MWGLEHRLIWLSSFLTTKKSSPYWEQLWHCQKGETSSCCDSTGDHQLCIPGAPPTGHHNRPWPGPQSTCGQVGQTPMSLSPSLQELVQCSTIWTKTALFHSVASNLMTTAPEHGWIPFPPPPQAHTCPLPLMFLPSQRDAPSAGQHRVKASRKREITAGTISVSSSAGCSDK